MHNFSHVVLVLQVYLCTLHMYTFQAKHERSHSDGLFVGKLRFLPMHHA